MIPLRDENPTRRPAYFTVGLIAACVLVFLMQLGAGPRGDAIVFGYGFIPSVFFGEAELPYDLHTVAPPLTLVTSMFLHGGIMHLGGNMLFLWIFGNNIEDELGRARFLIFYLAAGVLAALAQGFADPQSKVPMVGASGAISGILGAYILLYPRAKIVTLIWLGIFITTARISAMWFLGLWFAMQWLNALASAGQDGGGVAWWAHIGGFFAGIVLLFLLKPRRRPPGPGVIRRGPWG